MAIRRNVSLVAYPVSHLLAANCAPININAGKAWSDLIRSSGASSNTSGDCVSCCAYVWWHGPRAVGAAAGAAAGCVLC